ncbi:methyl-accepting chemotaxis protein [Pantoea sp. 1.19]|uniref:methyl-accepting chemotaxis protein n=1 Tax=Pantoea sp. 1.19 TaxID=1925589 RepID=UPI00094905AD|nr:methyl-accepting chemotaxis protein [Pantoea sp. 1.19]
MLNRLSIRTGLLALLLLMTLMLLVVSVMGIIAIDKGNQALNAVNRIQAIELNSLYVSNSGLLRTRATAALVVRKLEIGLPDEARQHTRRAASYVALSEQQLKRFIAAGTVTRRGEVLAERVVKTYHAYLQQGIAPLMAAIDAQNTDAYYALLEGNISQLAAHYGDAVSAFAGYANEVTRQQMAQAMKNQQYLTWLIIACGAMTLMLMALSWLLLRQMLLRPLQRTLSHLQGIAGGDLTQPLPPAGRNEFGRLAAALEQMQQGLIASVSRVRDASLQIDTGSRELASGNRHLSQRTEESAASLEQTAASMEQITATVRRNADNARQAHQLAQNVSETADRGSEVVCYVMEKMQAITDSARRIADILSVIDGIAFQTNILALNASVEAARAGEQGRGFAVVASEVRNLAQRSASAAKEIRTLIAQSQGRVSEGTEMALQAGETMDAISAEITQVTTLMREISLASQEQRNGIEQVNQAVTQMDEVAQQNAALVEQATAATRSLEDQSQQLLASMAAFRLQR